MSLLKKVPVSVSTNPCPNSPQHQFKSSATSMSLASLVTLCGKHDSTDQCNNNITHTMVAQPAPATFPTPMQQPQQQWPKIMFLTTYWYNELRIKQAAEHHTAETGYICSACSTQSTPALYAGAVRVYDLAEPLLCCRHGPMWSQCTLTSSSGQTRPQTAVSQACRKMYHLFGAL